METCTVCNVGYNPDAGGGFFRNTCSKECARIARLIEGLFYIQDMLQSMRNEYVNK